MKFNLKFLLTIVALVLAVPVFALVSQEVPDITDPSNLVVLLMAPITWLAVEAAKLIKKLIGGSIAGGWILGLIVPGLSALGAYILTLVVPDAPFLVALGLGLASTFVDQLIQKIKK